jgi:hypothetical protein
VSRTNVSVALVPQRPDLAKLGSAARTADHEQLPAGMYSSAAGAGGTMARGAGGSRGSGGTQRWPAVPRRFSQSPPACSINFRADSFVAALVGH